MKGLIFNIQKFSLNDGPGIRTVVFLKGCPLRCAWCSNPESQNSSMEIIRDSQKCTRCLKCLQICPESSISKDFSGSVADSRCSYCGKCVEECPTGALSIQGKYSDTDEIIKTVLQDLPFYEESSGGVTLSGGEVLFQPQFSIDLLKKLKLQGIDTAIETSGYASSSVFEEIADLCDHILFDMKHWDMVRHFEGTGVSNSTIISNMRNSVQKGRDLLIRIPVIPQYNSDLHDAEMFSHRLVEYGIDKVQLLPFHQFGENKYILSGKNYKYRGFECHWSMTGGIF
jgi:pyruvate formate lyase activating enzyme